jgi:uncharacterized protein with FMN-binding domain
MYPSRPDNRIQKIVASFMTILAVVLVTGGVAVYDNKQKNAKTSDVSSVTPAQTTQQSTNDSTAPTDTTTSTDSSSSGSTSASSYKDGSYTASSDYSVPNGYEDIKVTLTVSSGVVTNSQIMNSESDRESAEWQERFASDYKSMVVGKSLSGLNLSYVSGASDTTDGFNEALDKIRTQAQA